MNSCKKCDLRTCNWLAIVASLFVGILVGYFFSLGLVPSILAVTARIALRLAVLTIGFVLAGLCLSALWYPNQLRACFGGGLACLLIGAFGTVVAALIILSIALSPASIFSIIIVGLGAFFLALMIISLVYLIKCLICVVSVRT